MPSPRKIVLHRLTGRRRAVGALVAAAVALVAAALGVSSTAAAQTQTFTDISQDAYYSEAVNALASGGIFDGTECAQGMLCPGEPIDRKTMAVWTVRALDGEDPAQIPNSRFSDVAADTFHGPFIERMAELGVTTGCGDGTGFCPDNTVTRNQMAVFLTRAFKLDPGPAPGFSDVAPDAWYYNHVAALAASGITVGCGDGTTFCPRRQTTRAQMATFLARATGLVEHPAPVEPVNTAVSLILPSFEDEPYSASWVAFDQHGDTRELPRSVSVSPDGTRVVYAIDDDWPTRDLYVADADGTNNVQLTRGREVRNYSWSADGMRIAYTVAGQGISGLYVVDVHDTNTIHLAQNVKNGYWVWSPDGMRIAYEVAGQGTSGLYVVDVHGATTIQLAQDKYPVHYDEFLVGYSFYDWVWSPDGARIAYTFSYTDFSTEIPQVKTDLAVWSATGTTTVALERNSSVWSMQWSPDGTKLLYFSSNIGRDDVYYLFVVDADGDDAIPLAEWGLRSMVEHFAQWSPDGTLVSYSSFESGFGGNTSVSFAKDIFIVDTDGTNTTQLTQNRSMWLKDRREAGVLWSPDGTRIAYVDTQHRHQLEEVYDESGWPLYADQSVGGVFVADATGTNRHQITDAALEFARPTSSHADSSFCSDQFEILDWSQDSMRIAYAIRRNCQVSDDTLIERDRISITGFDGSDRKDFNESFALAWSPDGTSIALVRNLPGRVQVVTENLETGERNALLDVPFNPAVGCHDWIRWTPAGIYPGTLASNSAYCGIE